MGRKNFLLHWKSATCTKVELHQINLTFDQMTSRQISSNCFGQIIKISFFDQIIFIRFWWILTIWWKFDTFWSNIWPKRQILKFWSKIIWSNHQTSNDIWRFDATLIQSNSTICRAPQSAESAICRFCFEWKWKLKFFVGKLQILF